MAKLAIAGVILSLTVAPGVAMAQMDSRVGAPPMLPMPPMGAPIPRPGPMPHMPPMGQPMGQPMNQPMNQTMHQPGPGGDRWGSVPGGWNAYRVPSYGYTLPRYWTAPSYYISDYRSFGLPSPASGFGWSRYYDDMVLTDSWGRVYDWRGQNDSGRDMRDGDGRYDQPRKRDRSGIVGAIIGGAVGALTGNLIAGAGSRLAGSLIGGGIGALAGQAIDRSTSRGRGGYGGRDGYDQRGGYDGRGGYEGGYRMNGPHWSAGDYNGGSYGGCGCGQTVTTTTTTYDRPVVMTKITYVTEYVRVPAKHRVRVIRTKDRYLGGN